MRSILICVVFFILSIPMLAEAEPNTWVKAAESKTGTRNIPLMVYIPEIKKPVLFGGGGGKNTPYMQQFDTAGNTWTEFSNVRPPIKRGDIYAYYCTVYDPDTKNIFCLYGKKLYSYSVEGKKWTVGSHIPELDKCWWESMAYDSNRKKLIVVAADKRLDRLGWICGAEYDITKGTWQRIEFTDDKTLQAHQKRLETLDTVKDLVGRTRMAWYRDPVQKGTEKELTDLKSQCDNLKKDSNLSSLNKDIDAVKKLLETEKTLEALKTARVLQRSFEKQIEDAYPIPPSRRNAPIAYDPKNKVVVLFGGDHEDYHMNDTWVLDVEKRKWKRTDPEINPGPRAGHQLIYLPKSGLIAMYGGYFQNSSYSYAISPRLNPKTRELWAYNVKKNKWDLIGGWTPSKKDQSAPRHAGHFHGYSSQWYAPPTIAAAENDLLVFSIPVHRAWRQDHGPARTWTIQVDTSKPDTAQIKTLGHKPNERRYRTGRFPASYCEVDAEIKDPGLDKLAANQWVKLPPVPRNVCIGCRQRDWSTSVWDWDNDQFLLWGGGHCVRSSSAVVHYSPKSNRMVEGFDADEPYCHNGLTGDGSTVVGRPWVHCHGYNLYAYDPKAHLMVSARGFVYDPLRMDWLTTKRYSVPYRSGWGGTCVEASPHGAIVWAHRQDNRKPHLWLFDAETGFKDLKSQGTENLPGVWCDASGMVYDHKRDGMWICGGGKVKDGSICFYDFKKNTVTKLMPSNTEFGKLGNAREIAYINHADMLVFAWRYMKNPKDRKGKPYTRLYDCAKNRWLLLDAGGYIPHHHSSGVHYDQKRKIVLALDIRGNVFAFNLDPKSAKLISEFSKPSPPDPNKTFLDD
ncbi:kelch repeat-containing protein [Planctomycetota bacterium]